LREERRLKVFENKVLRAIFVPRRDGENNTMRSIMICTPHPTLKVGFTLFAGHKGPEEE
jgi:hypothetical protein